MKNQPTTGALCAPVGNGEWECTGTLFEGPDETARGPRPTRLPGHLWHQGESDAGQARSGFPADRQITGKQYREFMEKLILDASQKRAGLHIPWFVALATYHSETDPVDQEFRAAQRSLWENGPA